MSLLSLCSKLEPKLERKTVKRDLVVNLLGSTEYQFDSFSSLTKEEIRVFVAKKMIATNTRIKTAYFLSITPHNLKRTPIRNSVAPFIENFFSICRHINMNTTSFFNIGGEM